MVVLLVIVPVFCLAQETVPFGVCAHLQSGEEHQQMPQNLQMIREAGIRWMRTDFSWSGVESPQGTWHFDHLDNMVDELEKADIRIQGLLLYSVDWANPAYQHLDAWLEYVERTVTRYREKVRYWEIWNEPNMFWHKMGGEPLAYTRLLEVTYKKIKEIDPGLTVLYGGVSSLPYDFIEKSFEAGAGQFFDLFCFHPYRPFITSVEQSAKYFNDIERLRTLMAKYNLDKKKIWITEMGMTTMANIKTSDKEAFHEARESGKEWTVAVVSDNTFPVDDAFPEEAIRSFFPESYRLDFISLLDLKRIHPSRYDAVFFPPTENFPLHINMHIIPYLTDYLLAGGKVYYYDAREGTMYFYDDAKAKEDNQAIYLGQTILLSLRFGVERYFWYEFQSPERNLFDREDNFGLVHRELGAKPSYHAYSTLCRMFPEGSVIDPSVEWKQKEAYLVVSWTQKDKTRVWAAWSPAGVRKAKVKIGKGLRQALDHLGRELPVAESAETLELHPGVTYLVGAASLDFTE
jgi:hypothetical protein